MAFCIAFFWPFCFPYVLMVRLADKHNPVLIDRELRRREQEFADTQREIKELERRMQIGQNKNS